MGFSSVFRRKLPMPFYRIYSLDAAGHIKFAYDMECADDAASLAQGQQESGKFAVEVWQGARLVGQLKKSAGPQDAAP